MNLVLADEDGLVNLEYFVPFFLELTYFLGIFTVDSLNVLWCVLIRIAFELVDLLFLAYLLLVHFPQIIKFDLRFWVTAVKLDYSTGKWSSCILTEVFRIA